jgi:hypothetical protein
MKIEVGPLSQSFLDIFRNKDCGSRNPSRSSAGPRRSSAGSETIAFPPRHTFMSAQQPSPGEKSCPKEVLFKCLLGLNGKADGNFGRAIENFEKLIAEQTAVLTLDSRACGQFDAAIAGVAVRAGNVRFSHPGNMPRGRVVFQPAALSNLSGDHGNGGALAFFCRAIFGGPNQARRCMSGPDVHSNKLSCEIKSLVSTLRPSELDGSVLAFDIAEIAQAVQQSLHFARPTGRGA